jgi:hypothetical protein
MGRIDLDGEIVRRILAGSWRPDPGPVLFSEEDLDRALPRLRGSGAGSLTWWRIRKSPLSSTKSALELNQIYKYNSIISAVREIEIADAFTKFREHGIEPLLIKGWSAARPYPEPGLRPYGDIDLVVRSADFEKAENVRQSFGDKKFNIDLDHSEITTLDYREVDDFFDRSTLVPLNGTTIRVLSPEDHLRVIAIHTLKHGVWRPLWLCDIAAAVENRSPDFDWEYCLGSADRQRQWILSAIRIANELLDASIKDTPVKSTQKLPWWLKPTILKDWAEPYSAKQEYNRHHAPMSSYLRKPAGMIRDLKNRWPNPIAATIDLGGQLNGLPRLPFQLGNCLLRTARFIIHLPKTFGRSAKTISS